MTERRIGADYVNLNDHGVALRSWHASNGEIWVTAVLGSDPSTPRFPMHLDDAGLLLHQYEAEHCLIVRKVDPPFQRQ